MGWCEFFAVGAGGAALELLLLWAWPTDVILKLAFSAFMLPMALAAVWGARRALRELHDVDSMEGGLKEALPQSPAVR